MPVNLAGHRLGLVQAVRLVESRSTHATDADCVNCSSVLAILIISVPPPFVAKAATICPIGDCATSLTVAFAPFLGTGTAISDGTGGFTSFPTQPSISSGNIAFTGGGTGQLGIYLYPPLPVVPPTQSVSVI
jgi:hypothetical protein